MKFSELIRIFAGKRETYGEFAVMLVEPDVVEGDDIDVQLIALRFLLVDHDQQQIQFHSGAGSDEITSDIGLATCGLLIDAWPIPEALRGDYELLIQLPLAEEDVGKKPQQLVPLAGVHVGVNSGEVWLLVRPISEYSSEVLPD